MTAPTDAEFNSPEMSGRVKDESPTQNKPFPQCDFGRSLSEISIVK